MPCCVGHRVVVVGADIEEIMKDPASPDNLKYSVEFCGGTHLANTKQVGYACCTMTAETVQHLLA